MRKHIVLAAVAALIALAGCTSGDTETTSPSGGSGGSAPSTTLDPQEVKKAPGVTADAIKVGITYVDLEAIASVTSINHGDYEAAYRAVIDDLNEHGGINGRKLEPVFAPVNPIGTQPAEQACLKLTADEKVFVVMGFFQTDAVLCPVENHDTAVLGGEMTAERLQRAKAPWFSLAQSSDMQSDGVTALAKHGDLDGKLAVFAQVTDEALLDNTIKPLLDDLGIEPVATAVLDVPQDDVTAAVTQTGVIAQNFKSKGADKVLVVGSAGVTWANGIEKTDYRPQTLFITTNSISAYTENAAGKDLSVLDDAIAADGYGPGSRLYEDPNLQECFEVIEKATGTEVKNPDDVEEGEPDNFVSAFSACSYVTLFKALADKAGKDLNYATFRTAAEKAGAITIPGYPDPFRFGDPPHADGDPKVYLYRWNASTTGFDPLDE
jgi:ABC-type branched-subunit amino acid transport system substrate-binding protein